jgi:hypothetical protein
MEPSDYTDLKYEPSESIVLRYHSRNSLGLTEEELLMGCVKEGEMVFHLVDYKDCQIYILDETSLMHSNTFHALDGALIGSLCKKNDQNIVVVPSGGNLGTAITLYFKDSDAHVFVFTPYHCLCNLPDYVFQRKGAHLIAVRGDRNKTAAIEFSKRLREAYGLSFDPFVMKREYRAAASNPRGYFIAEHMVKNNILFDWISQTISAAFGPIGIYQAFDQLLAEKFLDTFPRFLAVQQEENAPMFQKIKGISLPSHNGLLLPNLYDRTPETYGTYDNLKEIIIRTRGDICTINRDEYHCCLNRDFDGKTLLNLFWNNGVDMTRNDDQISEKTGLVSLMGALKSIDNGIILPGEKVLVCFTGGVKKQGEPAIPELIVSESDDLDEVMSRYISGTRL